MTNSLLTDKITSFAIFVIQHQHTEHIKAELPMHVHNSESLTIRNQHDTTRHDTTQHVLLSANHFVHIILYVVNLSALVYVASVDPLKNLTSNISCINALHAYTMNIHVYVGLTVLL